MGDDTSKVDTVISETSDSTAIPDGENKVERDSVEIVREKEIGGRDGPDPTRYGDWEKNGRCIDF